MFLDTSGLLCYLDRTEARHGDAVSLMNVAPTRITHNYVLAELVALCQARGPDRVIALAFAGELAEDPAVEVVWVDDTLHAAALAYLRRRMDKAYSLCDAVSFLVMEIHGVT